MLGLSGIVRLFEEIEQRLVQSLKRNLSRHKGEEEQEEKKWSAWQAEKLRSMEKFRQENAAIMAEYTEQIDSETRQIMQEQFDEGVNGADVPPAESVADVPAEIKPEPQFFGVDTTKVNKLIEDVTHLEKHAETAALRLTDDVYRQTVNRVQLAMSTGSMTLQQAIDTAVKDFLDQGINCIIYRDGRRVNIADYVRMALRTTATRATLQGKSAKFKALGYDTVQVSSYGMCSPTCKPWQGRIYIEDTFSDWDGEVQEYPDGILWGKSNYCGKWFPLLSSAIEKGLFHPNCRHTILLWRDGDPLPESVDNTDSERRYKLEQQQRALEREIRKAKRKVEGFTDPENIRKARAELRQAQKNLKDFIDKVNAEEGGNVLRRDPGKEKIYEGEVPKAAEPVKEIAPPEQKIEPVNAPEPEIKEETASIPEPTASEPEAPEPQAVEISIPAPENQNADYTDEKIPQKSEPVGGDEGETVLKRDYGKEKVYEGEVVNNQSIDKYPNTDIIEARDNKPEIPEEIINDINKAIDKVAEDFPIIKELPEHIEYGDTGVDLGVNGLETVDSRKYAVIRIILSDYYCSDYSRLRQKLAADYSNSFSYETDNAGSLICHELGHSLHKLLALKKAGIKYGEYLDPLKEYLYQEAFKEIQSELYLAAFSDEGLDELYDTIRRELGAMPVDFPYELASQSIGNYYYGKRQSKVAKAIFEYFKKELS